MIGVVLGLILGAGAVLAVSPWLWPRGPSTGARARGWEEALRDSLAQAGLARVAPSAFVAVSALLGVAGGAVAVALAGIPALGMVLGAALAAVPAFAASARARRRRRAARAAWPDLVDHLVAGLRSGLSLPDAIAQLANSGPSELREHFAAFASELRARGNLGPALDELKQRLADPVADRVVETVRMAREVGGAELPRVLRGLSAALREEGADRAEAEARQSWVVSAARLGVAAPWIVLAVIASRPEAAAVYSSVGGSILLLAGFAVTIVAYRLMVALGRLPEERRWFA